MPSTPVSNIFSVNVRDVLDSVGTAIVVAVLTALVGIVSSPNFDVFTADWASIGHNMLNLAFVAFVGVLAKNFLSDSSGKLFGKF